MYWSRVGSSRLATPLRVVLVVLIAALMLAGAAAAGGGLYKGKSKQGMPVSFRVSGSSVKNFSLTGNALCIAASKSGNESYVLKSPNAGHLSGGGAFTISYVKNTTHVKITGKVSGNSSSGRVELHYTKLWQGSSGLEAATCWIKTNWTAKR